MACAEKLASSKSLPCNEHKRWFLMFKCFNVFGFTAFSTNKELIDELNYIIKSLETCYHCFTVLSFNL